MSEDAPGQIPHGTLNGHNHWGCRCEECREAYNKYQREYRRRRQAATGERMRRGRFISRPPTGQPPPSSP